MTTAQLSLVQQKHLDAREAKKKGYVAAGVVSGGIAVAALVTPWAGVPLVTYGGYLTAKWFRFRIKKGLRW